MKFLFRCLMTIVFVPVIAFAVYCIGWAGVFLVAMMLVASSLP